MNRPRMLLAAVATLAMILAACGGDGDDAAVEDDPAEGVATEQADAGEADEVAAGGALEVWIMQPGSEDLETLLNEDAAEFEEANDGVEINLQFVPWASAHDQFVTAIGGGGVPDVAEMGTTWTPEFASLGGLAPLEGGADGDYIDSMVESASLDGEVYGAPWYAGARGLIYRSDVFDELGLEAPATWEEVVEAGETIKAETELFPFGVVGNYTALILPMIWQFGGEIAEPTDEGFEARIDSPEAAEAWELYGELFQEGWSPEGALTWNSADLRNAFAQGDVAMMVGGGWDVAAILSESPDLEGSIGTTLSPEGPGGSRDAFAGGSHLVTFAESENAELGRTFIDFMLEPERVSEFATTVGFLPGTASGIEATGLLEDELYGPFAEQLRDHSRTFPAAPEWGAFEGDALFTNAMQQVMSGDMTAEEALADVQAQMEEGFAGS